MEQNCVFCGYDEGSNGENIGFLPDPNATVYPLKNNKENTIRTPDGYPFVHIYPVDANNNAIYPSTTITVTVN